MWGSRHLTPPPRNGPPLFFVFSSSLSFSRFLFPGWRRRTRWHGRAVRSARGPGSPAAVRCSRGESAVIGRGCREDLTKPSALLARGLASGYHQQRPPPRVLQNRRPDRLPPSPSFQPPFRPSFKNVRAADKKWKTTDETDRLLASQVFSLSCGLVLG